MGVMTGRVKCSPGNGHGGGKTIRTPRAAQRRKPRADHPKGAPRDTLLRGGRRWDRLRAHMTESSNSLIVYPGTFDPLTLGHLDLLERAAGIFDRVVLAVAGSSSKIGAMFPCEERIEMAREVVRALPNVGVERMDGMLVDFCHEIGARVVLRGLRAYSDFEYEFQMALTNRKLAPDIETLFMMPREDHSYVSSSIVREIAAYAGDTSKFVPPAVQLHIERLVVMRRLSAGRGGKDAR